MIPRFETEGLVEIILSYLPDKKLKVLDIGTGSGCIAITLKKKRPAIDVVAIDISRDALELAKINAQKNDVKVTFIESDLFTSLNDKYDIIVSNPPYISYNEEIMDVVKNNEPHIALYAANDGLYYYEEILKQASKYLHDKYYIFFEIGYLQGAKVASLAHTYLDCLVEIKKDLNGFDRYVIIQSKR